ncbi:hypothetical protein GUB10_01960 [Salegentibacter sp. BLCTC]|uniref:Uncharacterized protein n=1 Tax=Salegentibacter echinorum TaxID=1073325 RepID=A0A1M5FRL2_SALEC|nr:MULTISPECIES: hypothetical protein [Salegentibacter]MBE7639085.1 hypothetical protein [Salegentibacter sp. BLCTC]SHF94126.1 hypothetical protein SAMN05444483_103314 [Salegentibacter echinorum]
MKRLTNIHVGTCYHKIVQLPPISGSTKEVSMLHTIPLEIKGFKALGYGEI